MFSIVFLLPILITAGVLFLVLRPILKMRAVKQQLLKTGKPELGTVVSIGQTGLTINNVPQMAITLDLRAAGEAPRRIVVKQMLQFGNIPSVGDNLYVLVDPANPDNAMIAGAAPKPQQQAAGGYAYAAPGAAPGQAGQTEQQRLDLLSISPRLREAGKLGIATITAIRPQQAPDVTFDLDIDSINKPIRKVTITQAMYGEAFKVGERVYLLIDPDKPESMAIMPVSATGGQHIPAEANRLDANVLGPQILYEGAKGKATVLEATQIPVNDQALAARGVTRYHLKVHIIPDDGSTPYDAEQDLSFIHPDRAARIAVAGAEIPIRYDTLNRQCWASDAIALGYPDPYKQIIEEMAQKIANA